MTDTERIKKAIKWLIGSGIAKTQEGIGLLMGYSNKSAFSQVVNNPDKRPEDFVARLCNLNNALNKNWLLTGEGSMLKDNNTGATPTDNNSTNPTNTQAKMDPITMDYINTLKEQLAEMTAIVKNQNAVIERLSQKSDDEALSRRLGAVEKKQDELTDKP